MAGAGRGRVVPVPSQTQLKPPSLVCLETLLWISKSKASLMRCPAACMSAPVPEAHTPVGLEELSNPHCCLLEKAIAPPWAQSFLCAMTRLWELCLWPAGSALGHRVRSLGWRAEEATCPNRYCLHPSQKCLGDAGLLSSFPWAWRKVRVSHLHCSFHLPGSVSELGAQFRETRPLIGGV